MPHDTIAQLVIAAVFGLLTGSFLNVCIYRLPREESIVFPRSRCPSCGHVLSPAELFPVISWLVQRRKCTSCHGIISSRYAIVELVTAGIFVFCYHLFVPRGDWSSALAFTYFLCALVVIIYIDIDHMLILDVMTYPGMAICLAWSWFGHFPLSGETPADRLIQSACGLILGGGLLWAIQFLGALWYSREGLAAMGLGDVKLAAFTGAFLGPRLEGAALVIAVFIGGTIAVVLMIFGKAGRKDYIPFGPALAAGAALAPFFGDWILSQYHM